MINRQVWEETGSGAGFQELALARRHVHFLLPPHPPPESSRRDSTSTPPSHPQWLPAPLDEDFSWRRGKEHHDGGNLVHAATPRWTWHEKSDSELELAKHLTAAGSQRQHGLRGVANGTERQSAKGLPRVVWPLLWGQLISPSHNTGFNRSSEPGDGAFCVLSSRL